MKEGDFLGKGAANGDNRDVRRKPINSSRAVSPPKNSSACRRRLSGMLLNDMVDSILFRSVSVLFFNRVDIVVAAFSWHGLVWSVEDGFICAGLAF